MSVFPVVPTRPSPWWCDPENQAKIKSAAQGVWAKKDISAMEAGEMTECNLMKGIYVYNKNFLKKNFQTLRETVKSASRVFFAMKANSNPELLIELEKLGCNFECVSLAELSLVKKLFPGISGDRILFTPNFASRYEFEAALRLFDPSEAQKIHVTIDNTWVLENWGDLFENRTIFLRIDPGEDGHGHHSYVFTGSSSKFGIERHEVRSEKFLSILAKHSITVEGLHMHKGSGITDPTQWKRSGELLTQLRDIFPKLKFIDCGGGLGIPYKPNDPSLPLEELNLYLSSVSSAHPDLEFWIEPGRFIAAQCGVLLVQVTQLKSKGPHRFVGVNAGMNHLIRPALYESYHHIVNLSRFDERYLSVAAPKGETLEEDLKSYQDLASDFSTESKESRPLRVDIVGPICETGDFLGRGRALPCDTQEGDIILVDNAGAYGYVMASQYNLRPPGPEIFI